MQTIRYRHDYHKAFQATLKQRVKQYFCDSGQDRTGNQLMWFKISFFVLWMLVGYVILFTAGSFWQLLVGYLVSGSGSLLTVITVGHDASHKALSRHPWVNRLWSHTWGLIGLSHYLWELKHHHAHHAFTNVIGYDQDIEQSVLVRLNPKQPRRWFHRYQHLYTPFLYLIFGIFAVTYREFKLFFVRRYGNMESQHSWKLLFSIIVLKAFYFGLNLVLPLLVVPLPVWQIVLCMLIMMSVVGFYIALVLVIPHINVLADYKEPDAAGLLPTDWFTHTLDVTVDASPRNRWVNWFSGGLNTHVVHHLFPSICHVHYLPLTPIVVATAREFGLTYHQEPFWRLVVDHFRHLARLGIRD